MIPQYRGAVISAVVGLLSLGLAGFLASLTDVSCGSDGPQMEPGDVCVTTSSEGARSRQTYDEALSSQRTTGGLTGGALAVVFLGLAAGQLVAGRRRVREQAAAGQATRELLTVPLPPDAAGPPPAAPPQSVSPDAVRAAWAAQLGGYKGSMPPGKRSAALVYLGLLAVVAIGLFAIGAGQGGTAFAILGMIAALCVAGFIAVLVRSPLVSKRAR